MQRWFEACGAGRSPGDLVFRTILPDGSVRFIRGSGDLIYDNEGKPAYMAGTVQDITARKRAEEELKKSEEKYRSIFENVQDIYFETSMEGTILEISPSVELV